jgi:hypothetical protein
MQPPWGAVFDGSLQSGNHDTGVHRSADRIADDLSRPSTEHGGEIDEAVWD